MFCPKCGSQNADETRFCRGCGADLSNLLTVVPISETRAISEKHIELFSSGLRGLMIGAGFLITSGLAFAISLRLSVLGIFLLAFASYFLGTGISRLFHSRALKELNKPDADQANPALTPGQTDYIKPSRSIYETDDLIARPISVTEHTTTHLEMDPDGRPTRDS